MVCVCVSASKGINNTIATTSQSFYIAFANDIMDGCGFSKQSLLYHSSVYMVSKNHSGEADQLVLASGGSERIECT